LKIRLIIAILILSLFSISCSSSIRFSNSKQENYKVDKSFYDNNENIEFKPGQVIRGFASYYSDDFIGRKTANGEIYSKNKYTAAHRTLPFGTKLKVTNLRNSKFVFVVVNDRGPFISGRVLDLSYSAAAELDMIKDGVAEVEIEIINE
jgi:rare lipoprotein A